MNQKLAIILFAFAFIVAIVVGFGNHEELRPAPEEFRAKVHETLLKPRKVMNPEKGLTPVERSPSSEHGDRRPAAAPDLILAGEEPLSREAFAQKYGKRLVMTDYEHRVIRIDGSGVPEDGYDHFQKVNGFRPSDSSAVTARAQQVFQNARQILGISDNAEYITHPPESGESSSLIVIQQSEKGIPISPGGLVTILLGPEGELRAIDSSIYPKTKIANSTTRAKPAEAREILYVTESAPIAVLHHAFETRKNGIQKVTDAQTGEVLLEKDRRIR